MSQEPNEAELELAQEIDAALVKKTGGVRRPMNSSYAIETIAEVLAAHRAADEGELAKALEECVGIHGDRENFIRTCANILRNAELEPGEDWDARMMHVGELHDTAEAIGHARAALALRAAKGA